MTDESRPWLYDLVVVEYPNGMSTGPSIRERAKFAGYFLKLQGYLPHDARPGQRPEKAPLLIGRLRVGAARVSPPDKTLEWALGTVLVAGVGLFLMGRLIWRVHIAQKNRLAAAAEKTGVPRPGTPANPVDAWLRGVEQVLRKTPIKSRHKVGWALARRAKTLTGRRRSRAAGVRRIRQTPSFLSALII